MRETLKRALDVVIAGAALITTAPVIAIAAAAVRLDSKGPAVFRQTRIGRGRRPIQTLKLRTMISDAERVGPRITAGKDPRITRVGAWLRRTKLDELPQLWNVVRGDMSLVGPRPEVPDYVALYRPEWEALFSVRPGLTDAASLTFRHEEQLLALARDRERAYREVIMPLKLALSMRAIERSSPRHDLAVLGLTVLSVFTGYSPWAAALHEAERQIATMNTEHVLS